MSEKQMKQVVLAGRRQAVQYVRMSTEHQRYSLNNQQAAIADYALERGYEVIATYADAGKSGLTLKERGGLSQLLHDVTDPRRRFSTILVLDISRWGRFQDPDQHGAYEFLCREMGVNIEYVGEPFENDGSSTSSLMKGLKRIMAAEYSRELSSKVSRAVLDLARRGHKLGSTCLYGFRRMVLDENGNAIRLLEAGEYKFLKSDRVVLVHGPQEEIAMLRRIFRLYVDKRQSVATIARTLNRDGVLVAGSCWSPNRVRYLLGSELMIGTYVFGKSSRKLKGTKYANPESMWVRTQMTAPIISEKKFREAARLLNVGYAPYSKEKILKGLKRLLKEKGCIKLNLIQACPYLPCTDTIRTYFGTVTNALEQIGYHRTTDRKKKRSPIIMTEEQGLEALRTLNKKHGYVSLALIRIAPNLPGADWYYKHFGSMLNAYAAAGITTSRATLQILGRRRSRAENESGPPDTCVPPLQTVTSVTNEELIAGIQRLHAEHGYISGNLIDADPSLPPSKWIYTRYASLMHAYQMAGFNYTRGELGLMGRRRTTRRLGV